MTLAQEQGRLKTLEVHPSCTEEDPRCVSSFKYSALRNQKTGMNRVVIQGRLVPGEFDLKTLMEKLPIIQDEDDSEDD